MRSHLLRSLVVIIVILLAYGGYHWYQREQDLQGLTIAAIRHNEAVASLETGMSRSEAEAYIRDVVIHYQCKTETRSDDWYLFYERPNYSAPLNIIFKSTGNTERITAINAPEGYLVPSHCARIR